MKNGKIIKAGVAQWDIRLGDLTHNIEKAEQFIESLCSDGADLCVLPEMWSSGFDYRNLDKHAEKTPVILDGLKEMSVSLGITICGSLPEKRDGRIFNSMFVVDSGEVKTSYSKIHLFTPTGEDRSFSAGEGAVICQTKHGILGLIICYDLRFPELCRALTLAGAGIIVCSAQWPGARIHHWNTLLAARAIENQVFIVASNRCGKDSSIIYGGSSRIISPYGRVIGECHEGEESVVADIDPEELVRFRKMMPCLEHIKPGAYNI
ncbi:carbon-nitrogen family hydrolase [Desulforegula conservatrix]|uniref:carbon-nitrogen family hydrolase n=1 Tax=Desulforegula conservatrix TaxID=153026 RepID=UPI0004125C23|nr:carbon-nitrogen family hydrolase [Desulforegula conservatrix]